jgi:hypothetical protein
MDSGSLGPESQLPSLESNLSHLGTAFGVSGKTSQQGQKSLSRWMKTSSRWFQRAPFHRNLTPYTERISAGHKQVPIGMEGKYCSGF